MSAVGTAHSLGIVHRDLKPANIFLHERTGGEPLVKVLDFGLAKWVASLASASDPRTKDGITFGTPYYVAPEQATGRRPLTHRADIWAIGVLLYECLAGSRPVKGTNLAEVVTNVLHDGITPIEELVPSLPAELSRLIGSMLSRDPDGRPRDLREPFAVLSSFTNVSAPTFGPPDVDLVFVPGPLPGPRPLPAAAEPATLPTASDSENASPAELPSDLRAYRLRRGVSVVAVAAAVLGLLALVRYSR
jgi:serine/threonine protein kinase